MDAAHHGGRTPPSDAVSERALGTSEFSASATASWLAPVTTKNSTAGKDDHRISPGVGGRGTDEFETLRVDLRAVRECGEPGICVAASGP